MSLFELVTGDASLRVRMAANLVNIDKASDATKQFLQRNGLEEQTFAVVLVLREALANAVIHGCKSDERLVVEYLLSNTDGVLTMVVEDGGPGFDWRKASQCEPQPEKPGGRGLNIMRQYFDTMEYNERGNKVVLKKSVKRGRA